MQFTRSTSIRIIKSAIILVIAGTIVVYAIWRSLNYARGPQIDIFEPMNGSTVASSTVTIRGQAMRVNSLSLNGNSISVDQQGNFNERIIIFPGLNKLTLYAHDQFGRDTQSELDLVGM